MFWEAVLNGFRVFTHWELYAAGMAYVALWLAAPGLQYLITSRWERAAGPSGCLMLFVSAALQTLAMIAFVMVLSPIILGFTHDAAWSLPWQMASHSPWGLFKLVLKLGLATFLCMFIPVVGKWDTLQPTVVGSLALLLLVGQLEREQFGVVTHGIQSLSAGFGPAFGFLILGTACAAGGSMVVERILSMMRLVPEWLQFAVSVVVTLVLGAIPVFMFGAYLGAELRLPR